MEGGIPGQKGSMGPFDPQKSRKSSSSKSDTESKIGERDVSKGEESSKADSSESKITDIANRSLEASVPRKSGASAPAKNLLGSSSKAVFLFQRKIALMKLDRTGVAGGDLKGRVAKFYGELETAPKVKAIWARQIQRPQEAMTRGALYNFTREMVSLLQKEHPEMRARTPKDPHFASQGVIIVANSTEIPDDAPGILMTEAQYAEKVAFLEENITLNDDDSLEDKDFVRGTLSEILTWKGGWDFLNKCASRGKLPLIQKGVEWGAISPRHVEFCREEDLSGISFRTDDGKPFKGAGSDAIALAHELWHTMDPLIGRKVERFQDDVMEQVWYLPCELRAVTVANFFRKGLYLGERSAYSKAVEGIPIYPDLSDGGARLLEVNTTLLNREAITKHTRLFYIRGILLGEVAAPMPLDMTVKELEMTIESLSPKERKKVKSINISNNDTISSLPENIGLLSRLKKIEACNCISLDRIPSSIGGLHKLIELDFTGCLLLENLPKELRALRRLHSLNLMGCSALQKILDHIQPLVKLSILNLEGCSGLTDVPKVLQRMHGWRSAVQLLPNDAIMFRELK